MRTDFKSKEADIIISYARTIYVKNKKTGQELIAKRGPSVRHPWECFQNDLCSYPDKDIWDQIDLNDEDPGSCFHMGLCGYSNEELYAELEARKTRPAPHCEDDRDKMIAYMLKEVGLPSIATLRKHKNKNESGTI